MANSTRNTPPSCADVGPILTTIFASTEVTLLLSLVRTDWPHGGVIAGVVEWLNLRQKV